MSQDKWTCRGYPVIQPEKKDAPTYVDTGLESRGRKILAEEGYDEEPQYKAARARKAAVNLREALDEPVTSSALHHVFNQSVTASLHKAASVYDRVVSLPEAVLDGHLSLLKYKGVKTDDLKSQWTRIQEANDA